MARRLETVSLCLLLGVVGLRPLISERYDSAALGFTRALAVVEDASPAATIVIDGVILLASLGWLAARAMGDRRRYRTTGLEWGGALIAIAAAASCMSAGNKRLAVNGAIDWICCILLAVVLVQLMRTRRRVQLALCVVLATGAAQAAECFHQVFYSFPETEAMYQEQREEIWSRQGLTVESERARLFEARLKSREAFGNLSHSNIAGAHLVLCGLAAAGLGWSRWREYRSSAVATWLIAAVILTAAALTHSRAALLAGAVVGVLCLLRFIYDDFLRRRRDAVFRLAWGAVILATAAVVGHGLYHGSLPGRSLDFRWQYWTASAQMVADHPLTGVGSGNFGRHYLQYKQVESPEEVKNPHNFLASTAAEWGIPGAIGLLMMLFGTSRVICGGRDSTEQPIDTESDANRAWLTWTGIAVAILIFGSRVFLLGSDDPNHVYFATMFPLLAWAGVFIVLIVKPLGDAASLGTVLGFALLGFLLQDTVNFATLEPGTLTTAFACLAIVVSAKNLDTCPASVSPQWPIGGAVAMAAASWLVLGTPVLVASGSLRDARSAQAAGAAIGLYEHAARRDALDPTPLLEATRLLRNESLADRDAQTSIDRAIGFIDAAIERDPFDAGLYREKAWCHAERARVADHPDDWSIAINAAQRAITLYPTSPPAHVRLGDILAACGLETGDEVHLADAISSYEKALSIDDARPAWEKLRRMRPADRDAVTDRIARLRERLTQKTAPN